MEYERIAIGVRSYSICDTLTKRHFSSHQKPLKKTKGPPFFRTMTLWSYDGGLPANGQPHICMFILPCLR